MEDYKHNMGLRIKKRRKELKLTQDELSEMIDVSVKHFSEVERGLTGLSIENLIKLSDILGVSLDYIIKGEADTDEWRCTLSTLQKVPKGKERLIKELINLGVNLSKEQ